MARQFDSVTPDIGAVDANNPYGTYLDEAAGIPGTPILAPEKNSIKAFFERLMLRTSKTFSGNADQAVGASQFYDAIDEVTTGDDPALADWAAGTYNKNDVVRHGGKQWFCGVASTINTPGPNSQWGKTRSFDKYLELATEKGPALGGFIQANNVRDVTNYAQYYKMGIFEWAGTKYEAWRVNIDGSNHVSGTSDVAKLLALYKFSTEVIDSDVAGTLTLKDYLGRVARSVDIAAGKTENVGDVQEDAFQSHLHQERGANTATTSGGFTPKLTTAALDDLSDRYTNPPTVDGSSGTPRTDDHTRGANWTEGVPGVVCIVPAGTI